MSKLLLVPLVGLFACGEKPAPADNPEKDGKAAKAEPAPDPNAPPTPVQQALKGEARPALLLAQAWFWKDGKGNPNPGPARLDIWREGEDGWGYTRLEDGDSNVFHKAMPYGDGILTIGAEGPYFKHWTHADGKWSAKTVWFKEEGWGGKFNRLRDIEIGDVDGDGVDEFVIATHDGGVVAVVEWDGKGEASVLELDAKADTFVHEVEIGDIDGDGKNEFFVTPSDRNKAGASQAGGVSMYRWDGTTYKRSWVEEQHGTHAKEVLAADLDGDGISELFSVLEAEIDPDDRRKVLKPVEVRSYVLQPDGSFSSTVIATVDDRQTRFLIPGDFDGDGQQELVLAAMTKGLFLLKPPAEDSETGEWTTTRFDQNSGGFEHAIWGADLDKDGQLELYVAADTQRELKKYVWNAERATFDKELLGRLDESIITWNITDATL